MPFLKTPVRLATEVAAGLLLFSSTLMLAQELPESLPGVATDGRLEGTSAGLPAPSQSWSAAIPFRFSPGQGSPAAVLRPLLGQEGMTFATAFDPFRRVDRPTAGFSLRLMSRMNREAQRFRSHQVSGPLDLFQRGAEDDLDSPAAASRSHEASRVVTRSIHRALNDELDHLARTSLGLGPALDFLQNLSLRRLKSGSPGRASQPGGENPVAAGFTKQDRLRGDLGLRLDAHPTVYFRARYRAVQGRIDLPLRNDPFRLSVESPLLGRGRIALSSGLPRDGQSWTTVTWNFSF